MKSKLHASIKVRLFALVIALGIGYTIGADFENFVSGFKGEPETESNQD